MFNAQCSMFGQRSYSYFKSRVLYQSDLVLLTINLQLLFLYGEAVINWSDLAQLE
jgi:hypothetical protein